MIKKSKFVLLVIMLCIPAAIFIFLKFFGDNRFDVEVFHQNGSVREACPEVIGQFYVADSLVISGRNNAIIVSRHSDDWEAGANIVRRLQDVFKEKLALTVFSSQPIESTQADQFVYRHVSDIGEVAHCSLLMLEKTDIVLIDHKRRVRGYYGADLDEIDRLIVETKILLENDAREEK